MAEENRPGRISLQQHLARLGEHLPEERNSEACEVLKRIFERVRKHAPPLAEPPTPSKPD
jgi:CRISPR/Cas system-associated protein endoribonuclease Cas2